MLMRRSAGLRQERHRVGTQPAVSGEENESIENKRTRAAEGASFQGSFAEAGYSESAHHLCRNGDVPL